MDFTHSFPEEEELRFLFEYTNHFELYGLPLQNLDVNARAPESARSVEEATHDPLGDRVTETAREDMEKENVAWRPDEVEPEVVSTSIPAPASSSHVRAGTANSSVTKEKRKAVAVEERGVEKSSTAVPIAVSRTKREVGPPVDAYRAALQQHAPRACLSRRRKAGTSSSCAVAGPSTLPPEESTSEIEDGDDSEEFVPKRLTKKARVGPSKAAVTATGPRRKKRTPAEVAGLMRKKDADGQRLFVPCRWPENGHNCEHRQLFVDEKERAVTHLKDDHQGLAKGPDGRWPCLWGKASVDDNIGGCRKTYESEYALKRHIQDAHLAAKFPCSACGTPFARPELLDKHLKSRACERKQAKQAKEAAEAQARTDDALEGDRMEETDDS